MDSPKETLIRVLKECGASSTLLSNKTLIDQLIASITDQSSPTLSSFSYILKTKFALNEKTIAQVVDKACQNQSSKLQLGAKLMRCWLRYRLYQELDITRQNQNNLQSREKLAQAMNTFKYQNSNLFELLNWCFNSMEDPQDESTIQELAAGIEISQDNLKFIFPRAARILNMSVNKTIKNSEEQLYDQIQDYHKYPEGTFIKQLHKELIISYYLKYSIKDINLQQSLGRCQHDFQRLKQLYQREYGEMNKFMKNCFKILLSQNKEQRYYHILLQVKAIFLPINVFELQRLINKTLEVKKMIEKKDILFFLGSTGSGKSTNILKFLGYTLESAQYKGLPTLIPVQALSQLHDTFYTSPQAVSCTRYINAAPIPSNLLTCENKNILICDSPGFGDSAGSQVDIANGVGMIKALQDSSSVRMVVIIAYDALTSDRMKGVIEISQVISALFYDLSQIMESICIFFNKVPEKDVNNIPKLIQNKMQHLSSEIFCNEKIMTFLGHLYSESCLKERYIDPLKSNYSKLLKEIIAMPANKNCSDFRYSFSDKTKKQITNFITILKSSIKDNFQARRYQSSKFYFSLIIKLSEVLLDNKIKDLCQEMREFIINQSKITFKFYEDSLIEVFNGVTIEKNCSLIVEYQLLVKDIHENFKEIQVVSFQSLVKLKQEIKVRLLNRIRGQEGLNSEQLMPMVKKISSSVYPNLIHEALAYFLKEITERYKMITKSIETQQFSSVRLEIQVYLKLSNQIIILQGEQQESKLKSLFSPIKKDIDQMFQFLNKDTLNYQSVSTLKNAAQEANDFLRKIQQYEVLDLQVLRLNISNRKRQYIKKLSQKCQNKIRNIDVYITEGSNLNVNVSDTMIKEANQEVIAFMKIDVIKGLLGQQYKYILERNSNKLKESTQLLRQNFEALKQKDLQTWEKNTQIIKKCSEFIIKASAIVDDSEGSKDLALSIAKQLIKYIKSLGQQIRSIKLRFSDISPITFQKISNLNKKITIYTKLANISRQAILKEIKAIKMLFYQVLKQPFEEIIKILQKFISQKNSYVQFHLILDKLQKFASYAISLEQIFNESDYHEIIQAQKKIKNLLETLLDPIRNRLTQFNGQQSEPDNNLKDSIRVLISIMQKTIFSAYISRHLAFPATDLCSESYYTLKNIKERLEMELSYVENAESKYETLNKILEKVNQYSSIETTFIKISHFERLHFSDMQTEIRRKYRSDINNLAEQVKALIRNTGVSNIDYEKVKQNYQMLDKIKTNQGAKNRVAVCQQFKDIQSNLIKQINRYRQQLQANELLENRQNIIVFIQCFYNSVHLQQQLESLFMEKDKNYIIIDKKFLKTVGNQLITVFTVSYQNILKSFEQYDFNSIESDVSSIGSLESVLYQVILDNQSEKDSKINNYANKFRSCIQAGSQDLRRKILQTKVLQPDQIQYYSGKSQIRLKKLLQDYYRFVLKKIEGRYGGENQVFTIDNNIKKYYENLRKSNTPNSLERKVQIEQKIDKYFNGLLEKIVRRQTNNQQRANIQNQINTFFQNIPLNLSKRYKDLYENTTIKLKENMQNTLKELSSKMIDSSECFEQYFVELQAVQGGNNTYNERLVEILEKVYREKSKIIQSLGDRFTFIIQYFVEIYKKHQSILSKTDKTLRIIISKYGQNMIKLISQIEKELLTIRADFEKTFRTSLQAQQTMNSLENILQIYYKLSQLSVSNKFTTEKDYTSIIIENVQTRLKDFYQTLSKRLKNEYISIISIEFSDSKNIAGMQNYLKYITSVDSIVKEMKKKLGRMCQLIEKKQLSEISQLFFQIQSSQTIMKRYKDEISYYMTLIQQFTFYDERRKNMSPQQICHQLLQIDKVYLLFRNGSQFINQYIYNNQAFIKIDVYQAKFQRLYEELYLDSVEQIENTFESTQSSQNSRVNMFNNITKIMMEKKIKFASKSLKQKHDSISKLMKTNFQKIAQKNQKNFQNAKTVTKIATQKIKVSEEQKSKTVQEVKIVYKEKITNGTIQIEKQMNTTIDVQTDAARRMELQNNKKAKIVQFKKSLETEKGVKIQQIEQSYDQAISELKQSIHVQLRNLAQSLVQFKKAILDINYDNQRQVKTLETFISDLSTAGSKFIDNLTTALESNQNDNQSLGKHILVTHPVFKKYVDRQRRAIVQGNDINYVIQNLQRILLQGRKKLQNQQLKKILGLYEIFKKKYQQFKRIYAQAPSQSTIISITTTCRDYGTTLKKDFYQGNKLDNNVKIELLAGIFALWTILKSEKQEQTVVYTLQPHPTQITTLILLLGISKPQQKLSNRLAQVGTGQGKSIVLAGLSCFLGLTGFKVKCACYSSYLSGRDEESFKDLFERLGVQNQIRYGTFNELCEEILNSGGTNFKNQVEKMLFNKNVPFVNGLCKSKISSSERKGSKLSSDPTILIIDEVDVFFNQQFFGNTYCPGIRLRGLQVTKTLEHVWRQYSKKGDALQPQEIFKSAQFKELINKYPGLRKILENQVHGMVSGAIAYKHDYFLIDKKLVYKDNDTIAHNISYGYKTVFANLFEYNRGNVSRTNLEQSLQISLMVAEFSYTKLPNYFDCILGVTGTLEVMPKYKKKQLVDRYNINEQYAIPSAFGNNRRRIENYFVVSDAEYEKTIIDKIVEAQERPVIVFFKGVNELNQFSQSSLFEPFLKRTYTLTEEHEASVRNSRIVKAVNTNFITLMTNSFGRGTDFILLDENIKNRGGLHVIHAFLSHDESEEIQIKGRTARQSNSGSYDCVLKTKFLEQLDMKMGHFSGGLSSTKIHQILLQAREKNIERLSSTTMKQVKQSDQKHVKVVDIFKKANLAEPELMQYIYDLNKYPQMARINVRTILGIDATGSMGHAIAQACLIIGESFQRAFQVLKAENVRGSFQIKIMIYRNYDCAYETILESTAFENTSENLRKFLNTVRAMGGWGCNEAVQLFLQAANREPNIDQIILIGDAPPNTVAEVTQKRAHRGESYWNSHNMPITNGDQQINILAQKGCPVHTFYLAFENQFKSISRITNGKSSAFNVHSPKATDDLTNFVVENIIYIIGNKNCNGGGDKLVQTYRKMYT